MTPGYQDSSFGFDYQSCGIAVSVHEQSSDISQGVTHSLETRHELPESYRDASRLSEQATRG